jgi:prevent-host-death family protein
MSVLTKPADRISATEARVHFGEIYRRVTENDETIIVERNGKPGLVILPIEEYEMLQQQQIGEYKRPDWLENVIRIGQEFAAERAGKPPIDWQQIIDEGREERDAQLLEGMFGREPHSEDA